MAEMVKILQPIIVFSAVGFGFLGSSPAQDAAVNYSKQIRPILAEYCFACHGFDSSSREAGLRLDRRDAAVEAGVIDLDDLENSVLLDRVFSEDPDAVMPPPAAKKVLPDEHKRLLKAWILQSAPYEEHWAFHLPTRSDPPPVTNLSWVKNPIDAFVLAKQAALGLQPSPPLSAELLFRRLSLDIRGLLPERDELDEFLEDHQRDSERAISQWIDRLMESPKWGEHRGRYWLDAARYGDTHGMHFDNYREMWPYRDWVIRSFNSNQPFNQFVVEQLAGDLLPQPTTDQLIATGFQRCNMTTNEGGTIEEENLALYAADRVQTFGWVFLGLTMNCAQCHDHKFDAITTQDYYGMAAFFRNTMQGGLDGNNKEGNSPVIYLPGEADLPRWNQLPDEIARVKTDMESYQVEAYERFVKGLTDLNSVTLKEDISLEVLELHAAFVDGHGEQVKTSRGTAIVSTSSTTWQADGKFGPAATITPQSTFVIGDAGNWDLDDKFSFGAWVKPDNRNTAGAIIARMDTANRFRGWDIMQANARFHVHLIDSWSDNAIKVRTVNEVVKDNRWQHVFVTYDGSRRPEGIQIYVDGRLQQTAVDMNSLQENASMKTDTPTRVGQRRADNYWSGSIQDLRFYRRALSVSEVEKIVVNAELALLLQLDESQRTQERLKDVFQSVIPLADHVLRAKLDQLSSLEQEYEAIRQRSPITHIQKERPDSEPQTFVLLRGEYDKKGESIKANTPGALHPFSENLPRNRLGLAQWVTDPANPVTARVTVNRFWQEVFGSGLVATPEDFGVMGSPPTNQQLLDWLAVDFVEHGWDVKRFFKQIFMSSTYRQTAAVSREKLEQDLPNASLSRGPRFRMDAEMIRDSALQVSGLLSSKMYGPGAKPYQPENIWNVVGLPEGNTRDYRQDEGENLYRRSVYTFWKRMAHPPNMEVLNAPSREVCVVRRERTNTPLQALVLLNDPIFVESARNLAQRTLRAANSIGSNTVLYLSNAEKQTPQHESEPNDWDSSGGGFVNGNVAAAPASTPTVIAKTDAEAELAKAKDRLCFQEIAARVLSRRLSDAETKVLENALVDYRKHYQANPVDAQSLLKVGRSPVDDTLDAAELAAWTMICQQFLNLDEAVTK